MDNSLKKRSFWPFFFFFLTSVSVYRRSLFLLQLWPNSSLARHSSCSNIFFSDQCICSRRTPQCPLKRWFWQSCKLWSSRQAIFTGLLKASFHCFPFSPNFCTWLNVKLHISEFPIIFYKPEQHKNISNVQTNKSVSFFSLGFRCWPCPAAPGSATRISLVSIWRLSRTRPWNMPLASPRSSALKASWPFPPTLWGIFFVTPKYKYCLFILGLVQMDLEWRRGA